MPTVPQPRVEFSCERCGAPFLVVRSQLKHRTPRFCSRICSDAASRKPDKYIEQPCATCGVTVRRLLSHFYGKVFCSRECASQSKRVADARWKSPEQIRAYMRNYHKKTKEQQRPKRRQWARDNHTKKLQIQKRYRQTHRPQILAASRARHANASAGDFTPEQWEAMKLRYDYRCLCCGLCEPEIKLEADHIVPVVYGGAHSSDNIQPLCRSCNATKSTRTIDFRVDK